MKAVAVQLEDHLHTAKNFVSCDLYVLKLASGNTYYYTNADRDIEYDGVTYRHNVLLIKRQQTKINDRVVVDTMTVTIHANSKDMIEGKSLLQAAHDGTLDFAKLHLSRCFFRESAVLGVIGLFGGNVEVKKCGGLGLELTVKAKTQGLAQEFPVRKYYPQGTYSAANGSISAGSDDDDSCLIAPFVPLKEVLL